MDARSVICLQNYEFLWACVLHPQRITLGVFYKLRDKERSKESAYVLFWNTPCSVIYGISLYTIRKKRGKQKNSANYTQTRHPTLHSADFPCVTKCIVCAENYTQTIHKPGIERQRVKESKSQRDKETRGQRVKETKRQGDKESKSQREEERKRQRVKETKRQGDKESKSQREDERKSQREGETKRLRVKETEEAS